MLHFHYFFTGQNFQSVFYLPRWPWQAQFLSTVRTTLESVNNPLLIISGVQLADEVSALSAHRTQAQWV